MKAILTKVLQRTNTRPARIVAYTEGGNRMVMSIDELDNGHRTISDLHAIAAVRLARYKNWLGKGRYLIGGGTPEGYVFVFNDSWIIGNAALEELEDPS